MPTKSEILKRVAAEARDKSGPEKAQALFDVYARTKGDKYDLAQEILALGPPSHVARTLRRDVAFAEVDKIDALTGKARDKQVEKAIAAAEASADRTTLLLQIADKVD